jgi:hypothetical protein
MSDGSNIPPNGPSVNLNINGSVDFNVRDFSITLKLDPSLIQWVQNGTGHGQTNQTTTPQQPSAVPLQHTLNSEQRRTSSVKRNDSVVDVEDVLSLESLSRDDSLAHEVHDRPQGSLHPLRIGYIDKIPVYDWKNYPYGPNISENTETAKFFIKKPDDESETDIKPKFSLKFAYSYLTYGKDSKRAPYWVRKQCMGVFQCAVKRCNFLATPVRGRIKGRYALPAPCKDLCPLHPEKTPLHKPCFAGLLINENTPGHYCVQVLEPHTDHPIPPQTFDKIPTIVKQGIAKKIVAYKDLGANALIVGTPKRTSFYDEFVGNPAVKNRDGVRRLKASLLKADCHNNILEVLSLYLTKVDLVVSHSIAGDDFHLCMQDKHCREFAKGNHYPLESDAVEGFLKVTNDFPLVFKGDKATGVMITSSYNAVTSRWSPLLITLMGGRTDAHYYHHFKVLLRTYDPTVSYEAFVKYFPGHTTDFSLAQSRGFLRAVREYVQIQFGLTKTDAELRTDLKIRFCTVHFKRTLYRVARNSEFIPSEHSSSFIKAVEKLLLFKYGQIEQFMELFLTTLRSFANVGPWLQWHIQPGIATVLFPACKDFKSEDCFRQWNQEIPNNTNAAESMCRKFQELSERTHMDLSECIPWTEHFLDSFHTDHSEASKGVTTFYGLFKKKQEKQRTVKKRRSGIRAREQKLSKRRQQEAQEDHRPPDTTERLKVKPKSPSSRKKEEVNEKFSLKNIPQTGICTSFTLLKFVPHLFVPEVKAILQRYYVAAVPWSIPGTTDLPKLDNTCGFDSVLFVLYFLQRNKILEQGLPGFNHPHSKVRAIFALLDEAKGDEARRLLIYETFRQERNHVMAEYMNYPGRVDAWSGGADSLSVLLYKVKIHLKERTGCSATCMEKSPWRTKKYAYHSVEVKELPADLELYLYGRLFGENIPGEGQCTLNIVPECIPDLDTDTDDEEGTKKGAKVKSLPAEYLTCKGTPLFDKELELIPSLFVLNVGQASDWADYTSLPETMTVGPLRFILRGVTMCNSSHFKGMVLIQNQWLLYDGMGPVLSRDIRIPYMQLFDSGTRHESLMYYKMSCIFYEVRPLDAWGDTLMCKDDPGSVGQGKENETEGATDATPAVKKEKEECDLVGNEATNHNNDNTGQKKNSSQCEETNSVGSKTSLPEVKHEKVESDILGNEATVHKDDMSSVDGDQKENEQEYEQADFLLNSLKKLNEMVKKQNPRAKKAKTSAKHPRKPGKSTTKQETKVFSFVPILEKNTRCGSCRKTLTKGCCVIRYHLPSKPVGRSSHYHAAIKCLEMMSWEKQMEFAKKKWTESVPESLAKELEAKLKKETDELPHLQSNK